MPKLQSTMQSMALQLTGFLFETVESPRNEILARNFEISFFFKILNYLIWRNTGYKSFSFQHDLKLFSLQFFHLNLFRGSIIYLKIFKSKCGKKTSYVQLQVSDWSRGKRQTCEAKGNGFDTKTHGSVTVYVNGY